MLIGSDAGYVIPSSRFISRSWNALNRTTENGEDLQLDGKL